MRAAALCNLRKAVCCVCVQGNNAACVSVNFCAALVAGPPQLAHTAKSTHTMPPAHAVCMLCAVCCAGHGTHIAGIVGAMNGNSSRGIVGVSPGTGVFSLKVFDGNGNGMLSKTLEAVKWVATDGIKKGIKVINLSLVAEYDPTLSNFKQITDAVCQYFQEASDAGEAGLGIRAGVELVAL